MASKEATEELTATITDSKATIGTEDAKVCDLATNISDTVSELSTLISLQTNQVHGRLWRRAGAQVVLIFDRYTANFAQTLAVLFIASRRRGGAQACSTPSPSALWS